MCEALDISGASPMRPKRLQSYETNEIIVTFDPARCTHSGVCVRGLGLVFDVTRRRWIRPSLHRRPRWQRRWNGARRERCNIS
jgi:uncharacterized Fe-S cluster protein YjdI